MTLEAHLHQKVMKIINIFYKKYRGYHCYKLNTMKLDLNMFMTVFDIINFDASEENKRRIVDGISIRLEGN